MLYKLLKEEIIIIIKCNIFRNKNNIINILRNVFQIYWIIYTKLNEINAIYFNNIFHNINKKNYRKSVTELINK